MARSGRSPRSLETIKSEDPTKVCSECGSKDIEYSNEEFYCKKCGLVLD
ncbi:MAG: TFIIB-type zinc ribbon-containing protein [Candidatus Woesearchaeota archaeon]|jgi:transposase|nr:TFIIB-type zinc ribbon-containing protein [Candidatus Woesearchaeota archaeon]MDP7263620.1 TFIIB-type zinc ribbon-containing protein [Candidatus Woesearchaeota archaeon]MDP7622605.1 TFIIB-type zinc ribbon-containing protein [Candidatus Woesearchaeota archaeon]HJN57361.1 TFIIB-type zinc ribbon-containing protein [Candidatus Woesearchaeota archaeon]